MLMKCKSNKMKNTKKHCWNSYKIRQWEQVRYVILIRLGIF